MTAADREELVGGLEDAELVLRPGVALALLEPRLRAPRRDRRARAGTTYEAMLRERILEPLGLTADGLRPEAPVATPYFVDPYADRSASSPTPRSTETTSAAGWLWSTVGDLARWGDFLCTGARRRARRRRRSTRWRASRRWWTRAAGRSAGASGSSSCRRGDRVLVGHGGAMPGFLAGLVRRPVERTGAVVLHEHRRGAAPRGSRSTSLEAALDALPRCDAAWTPGDGAPAGRRRPLLGLWWTEGEEIVLAVRGRAGSRPSSSVARRDASVSCFEPDGDDRWRVVEGRERGELLRVVRDADGAVVRLYLATYPLTRAPATFGVERLVSAAARPATKNAIATTHVGGDQDRAAEA